MDYPSIHISLSLTVIAGTQQYHSAASCSVQFSHLALLSVQAGFNSAEACVTFDKAPHCCAQH